MPISHAQGEQSYSGTYIPEIWSTNMLVKFYAGTCLAEIANTEWEGEIKAHGDKVHIRTTPDITIRDYVKGQKLVNEQPAPSTVELLIDKGKYYAWALNTVDKHQADVEFIDNWATETSNKMKIGIETNVFANIYSDADSSNAGATAGAISAGYNLGVSGTPLAITKTNVLKLITDVNVVLSEQNVPEDDNRYIIIPAWMGGLIKESDLKNASITGDGTSVLRTGRIGMIDNTTIYRSNLLATTTDGADTVYNVIAGHKSALTFASQVVEDRVIDNQDDFGKLHQGLQVYGYKVVKAESLVHCYVKNGS